MPCLIVAESLSTSHGDGLWMFFDDRRHGARTHVDTKTRQACACWRRSNLGSMQEQEVCEIAECWQIIFGTRHKLSGRTATRDTLCFWYVRKKWHVLGLVVPKKMCRTKIVLGVLQLWLWSKSFLTGSRQVPFFTWLIYRWDFNFTQESNLKSELLTKYGGNYHSVPSGWRTLRNSMFGTIYLPNSHAGLREALESLVKTPRTHDCSLQNVSKRRSGPLSLLRAHLKSNATKTFVITNSMKGNILRGDIYRSTYFFERMLSTSCIFFNILFYCQKSTPQKLFLALHTHEQELCEYSWV